MTDIDFPNNPYDGQVFVDDNKNAWIYDSTEGQWIKNLTGTHFKLGQLPDVNLQEIPENLSPEILKYYNGEFNNVLMPNPTYPDDHLNFPVNNNSHRYLFKARIPDGGYIAPPAVTSIINFNTEVFDSHNVYDTSNQRFNVPVTGYWQINVRIGHGGNQVSNTYIYVNGLFRSTILKHEGGNNFDGGGYRESSSTTYFLSVGDYVDIRIRHGSGGNLGLYEYETGFSEFSGYLKRMSSL